MVKCGVPAITAQNLSKRYRRRAAVETTFATWKRRMGLGAMRYLGLPKARAQVLLTALIFNMRRWAVLQPA